MITLHKTIKICIKQQYNIKFNQSCQMFHCSSHIKIKKCTDVKIYDCMSVMII